MKKIRFFIITILITFGGNAFFYFFNKLFISNYHLIGINLDHNIPLIPSFIHVYMIWYPFEIITFYFFYKYFPNKYIKLFISLVLALVIAHLCHVFYPTMVARPIIDSYHDFTSWALYFTYLNDTPVNCLPSIHCLICFIAIFITFDINEIKLRYKLPLYIINMLIILSTLFVKQHVIYDVIGAFLVAAVCYYLLSNLRLIKNIQNKLSNFI